MAIGSLPGFIPDGDQIVSKTYMTRVEGENTRLRHPKARLHRKTLCYSKCIEMLKHSIRLLIHASQIWRGAHSGLIHPLIYQRQILGYILTIKSNLNPPA